jgi:hypothetical protein
MNRLHGSFRGKEEFYNYEAVQLVQGSNCCLLVWRVIVITLEATVHLSRPVWFFTSVNSGHVVLSSY